MLLEMCCVNAVDIHTCPSFMNAVYYYKLRLHLAVYCTCLQLVVISIWLVGCILIQFVSENFMHYSYYE